MEPKEIIINHFSELLQNINCSPWFLSHFRGIYLDEFEIQELESSGTNKTSKFLDLIITREGGIKRLQEVLEKTKQTIAGSIIRRARYAFKQTKLIDNNNSDLVNNNTSSDQNAGLVSDQLENEITTIVMLHFKLSSDSIKRCYKCLNFKRLSSLDFQQYEQPQTYLMNQNGQNDILGLLEENHLKHFCVLNNAMNFLVGLDITTAGYLDHGIYIWSQIKFYISYGFAPFKSKESNLSLFLKQVFAAVFLDCMLDDGESLAKDCIACFTNISEFFDVWYYINLALLELTLLKGNISEAQILAVGIEETVLEVKLNNNPTYIFPIKYFLGKILVNKGDYSLAREAFLNLEKQILRSHELKDKLQVIQNDISASLACILFQEKQHNRAIKEFTKVKDRYLVLLGPDHVKTINTDVSIGKLYFEKGNIDAAMKLFQSATDGFSRLKLPRQNFLVCNNKRNIARCLIKRKQIKYAEFLLKEILDDLRLLGKCNDSHPEVLKTKIIFETDLMFESK